MKWNRLYKIFCVAGLALGTVCASEAQVNVTTWHNDQARTGANTNETLLTPSNVSAAGKFGQLFSVSVDGAVYAQPLYMAGVNINGGTHNVVFAATEHDSVYAIDADSGVIYWQRSFLDSGMTTVAATLESCDDIVPEIGITGTPVIDSKTGTLYVVAATEPGPVQRLHALDITTGQDKSGSPVTVSPVTTGSGSGNNGGTLTFNPLSQNQRAGLALSNGHLMIAWGAHCDHDRFHGWLVSYNPTTLAQETFLNTTPNGNDGGIWMSGGAPSIDANGNVFVGSGNGDFGNLTTAEISDSLMRLPPPSAGKAWAPVDGFSPWNQNYMYQHNEDLGASAALLLPDLPSGAAHRQLLVASSKTGAIYIIDRNNMGHYCASCSNGQMDTNIVQELPSALPLSTSGSPAYWNGTIYFGAPNTTLKAFSFNTTTGAVSTQPVQTGAYTFGARGTTPSISSNGNSNGILWVIDGSRNSGETLLAYDATNLSNLLYQSTFSNGPVRFAVPTVANGKVYVGAPNAVTAFGLLNQKPVLTITASNVTVPYGQPIPALTGYTATGFQNGDNSSVLSGAPSETTTATQNSPVGTYPINITQGSLTAANYTFQFVNGVLTISGSQSQTISFGALPNTTYGASAIGLTATASSGLPVSYSVTGPASVAGSTLNITGAGTVTVTASQAGNSSYSAATPVSQSFTVSPALLTITAANVAVQYNQPIPALTGYTASGFVNGDTAAVLSGTPAESTTATQGSPSGTYPISITQGSLTAANYTFAFANGTLTIATQMITPPVSLTFPQNPVSSTSYVSYSVTVGSGTAGQPNPVGTITIFGYLPSGQLVQADGPYPIGTAGSAGVSTFSNTLTSSAPPGQYRVYAKFQPASGTTYQTANSPVVVLVSQ